MRTLYGCFFVWATLVSAHAQTRYHVNKVTGHDANNGLDWMNAHKTLQRALSGIGDDDTIWVAQGIYYPDEGGLSIADDRTNSFYLYKGVNVYGGFQGTESSLDQRDVSLNPTILSGDLLQNDGPAFFNNGDNAYHVLVCANQNKVPTLDGFTVEGGNANSLTVNYFLGAGMFNLNADPRVLNCLFQRNYSINSGGGMENSSADTYLEGCQFKENAAANGGGMYNINATITMNECSFVGNMASIGAGMFNYGASVAMEGTVFVDNVADTGDPNTSSLGGGVYNFASSVCAITNSRFMGNFAQSGGGLHNTNSWAFCENVLFLGNHANLGGGFYNTGDSARLINCTFTGNRATFHGGAIRNHLTNPTLINTLIWNNADQSGVGTAASSMSGLGSIPIMTYCLIQNVTVDLGGNLDGMTNAAQSNYPQFLDVVDPTTAPTNMGNARVLSASVVINTGNDAVVGSGIDLDGLPRFNGVVDLGAYENPYANCPTTIVLDAQYSPLQGTYHAQLEIQTQGIVEVFPGATVTLSAPSVQLDGVFAVENGANFEILPAGCVSP